MPLIHLVPLDAPTPALPGAEGFVHLCWPEQVPAVIRRHFADGPALALVLDESTLAGPLLREEDSYGHGAYPHFYGPLSPDWVIGQREVAWKDDAFHVDGARAGADWAK